MNGWRHKDIWIKADPGFAVEVSRHSSDPSGSEGPNRWCVYAYIYPTHPHFCKFEGSRMWQDAATEMPLHGGPSLLVRHIKDDGSPASIQVGSDYHHDGDCEFTHYADAESASQVFADAENLFSWLQERERNDR